MHNKIYKSELLSVVQGEHVHALMIYVVRVAYICVACSA